MTKEGYIKTYDPKTNRIGVFSPDGKTETFYATRNYKHYLNIQKETLRKGGKILQPFIQNPVSNKPSGGGGIGGGGLLPYNPVFNPFNF